MDSLHPPRKKKTKSELIRVASLSEYVEAHAKPNGNGWKGFFKSNLFTALVMFLLTQSVIITGLFISNYYKTTQLAEWKGQTDAVLKRMDEQGTIRSHNDIEKLNEKVVRSETKIEKLEEKTSHIEVMESEQRRLTRDVEELRNGKK